MTIAANVREFLTAEYPSIPKVADLIPALTAMAPHRKWTTDKIHNEAAGVGLTRAPGVSDGRGPLSHEDRDHEFSLAHERLGVRFDGRIGGVTEALR
jgi:hypothetical protein